MYSEKDKRRTSGGHNLAYKMWACKGARFEADKRCKRIAKLSSVTISLLSFEVIAISIYSLTGNLNNVIDNQTISSITLILSILFLVLSIFENAKEYSVKSKEFHNCGLEIGKIYSKLKLILAKNKDNDFNDESVLYEISQEYETILEKYDNHENIDYLKFQVNKSRDFKIHWITKIKNLIQIYISSRLLYHFLILGGPIIITIIYLFNIENDQHKNINKIEHSQNKVSIDSCFDCDKTRVFSKL